MATQVQYREGTTAQHGVFTGAASEVTVDTDKLTLVVHDGSTTGGFPLLRNLVEDLSPMLGADLDMNGQRLIGDVVLESPTVPALATDPGVEGQIAWDADFMYVCVATNTWKRTALATW